MDALQKTDLKEILQKRSVGCICISIYMPTYLPGTANVQQNPVRLRNLLRTAEEELVQIGLRNAEAVRFLESGRGLLDNGQLWRQTSDGLVVFITDGYLRYFRLPLRFKELLAVGDRFHIKPLNAYFEAGAKFYLLAVSQKRARLFQGTRYGMTELDLAKIAPSSLPEFLKYDDEDREQQYHAHVAAPGSNMPGAMTAHGREIAEEHKDDLMTYFRALDRGLNRGLLHEETVPLVLAADGPLFPLYREANTYPHLLKDGIPGNPDRVAVDELRLRAADVAQSRFDAARNQALVEYRKLVAAGSTSNDLKRVVSEASRGRVEYLFAAEDAERWGTFDSETDSVALHSSRQTCDQDLVNMAVVDTLQHKGTVHTLRLDEMPDKVPLAAIFWHGASRPHESTRKV